MKEERESSLFQSSAPSVKRIANLPLLIQKIKSTRNLGRNAADLDHPDLFSDTEVLRKADENGAAKEDHGLERRVLSREPCSKHFQLEGKDKDDENHHGASSRIKDRSIRTDTSSKRKKTMMDQTQGPKRTDRDVFLDHAVHLENLMEEISNENDDDASNASTLTEQSFQDAENGATLPLNESSALLQEGTNTKKKNWKKPCFGNRYLYGMWRRWKAILRPEDIRSNLEEFFKREVCFGMLPPLVAALVLFYGLGNPHLELLPNTATLAWDLIFVLVVGVVMALARISQFIILEVLTLRTSYMAQWTGPFVAIMAMQAMGWPFLLAAWGAWNIMVLHGHHPFCKHWLDFTNVGIFTVEHNPDGDGILQSDLYGRILFAMVFVGTASALKRTTVALFLSRRMLRNYRDQLERIMSQVRLIAGVAGLAAEADRPGFDELLAEAADIASTSPDEDSLAMVASQIQIERTSDYMEEVPVFASSTSRNDDTVGSMDHINEDLVLGDDDAESKFSQFSHKEMWEDLKAQAREKRTNTWSKAATSSERPSCFEKVFASLDRYEPPSNNAPKQEAPSLHDILQFKKANTFMTNGYPFTTAFGPAGTRKKCARSAIEVYRKLQKFTPDSPPSDLLSFDVIGALAYQEDGTLDKKIAQGLLRLFFPDNKDNCVSLNAFVQACDAVHKQIVFLAASMNNSSKIDSVLGDMFNVFFYGVLAVMNLSLLGLNIWPLLVSFSTVLLSLAFALGPSCAKMIEGILAIAVRRPFDLGDRISLATGLAIANPASTETWIVEDINLMTTTLRFAPTNELSTINNATLAAARIVNCARSDKAIVRFRMVFRADASVDQLADFKKRLGEYLRESPRVWAGLLQFANDGIDSTDGFITYMIGVQNVESWQEVGKIVTHRGELQREALQIAKELKIEYVTPSDQKNIELVTKTTNVS